MDIRSDGHGHRHAKERRRVMRINQGQDRTDGSDTIEARLSGPVQHSDSSGYDHDSVVKELGKERYCDPRRDYSRIVSTSGRQELIALGYEMKEENPRLAADIFTRTGCEEGVKEMKEILFGSDDSQELSFAYHWRLRC